LRTEERFLTSATLRETTSREATRKEIIKERFGLTNLNNSPSPMKTRSKAPRPTMPKLSSKKKTHFEINLIEAEKVIHDKSVNENINEQKKKGIYLNLIISIILNTMNVFSIITYMIQTFPIVDNGQAGITEYVSATLDKVEFTFSWIFLVEFIINFFLEENSKFWYIFSWNTAISCITIIPSITIFLMRNLYTGEDIKLHFFRIFRIFRVFKILRVLRMLKTIENNDKKGKAANMQEFQNQIKLQFGEFIVVVTCCIFISAGLMLTLSDIDGTTFNQQNMNIADALYFVITTSTTIGFGDIVPASALGRVYVIALIIGLIIVLGDQLSKLLALYEAFGPGTISYTGSNHMIIISGDDLNLHQFIIDIRKHDKKKHVVVITQHINKLSNLSNLKHVYLINCALIDYLAFTRANISQCDTIFLMTNNSPFSLLLKDKVSEFYLTKINEITEDKYIIYRSLLKTEKYNKFNKQKELICNKIVTINKLKMEIMLKSSIAPGFSTFIQNLYGNDYYNNMIDYNTTTNPVINEYLHCSTDQICVVDLQPYIKECLSVSFFYLFKIIYLTSVNINLRNDPNKKSSKKINGDKVSRGILLLGIIEDEREFNNYTLRKEVISSPKKEKHDKERNVKKKVSVIDSPNEIRGCDPNDEYYHVKIFPYKEDFEKPKAGYGIFLTSSIEELINVLENIEWFEKQMNYIFTSELRMSGINNSRKNHPVLRLNMIKYKTQLTYKFGAGKNFKNIITPTESTQNLNDKIDRDQLVRNMELKELKELNDNKEKHITKKGTTELDKRFNHLYENDNYKIFTENFTENTLFKESFENQITEKVCHLFYQDTTSAQDKDNDLRQSSSFSGYKSSPEIVRRRDSDKLFTKYSSRILDICSHEVYTHFSDHIVVIGYEESLHFFINYLQIHYSGNQICLITDTLNNEKALTKLLKTNSNFFVLKGDYVNINNLCNVNLNMAKYVYINQNDNECHERGINLTKEEERELKNDAKSAIVFKMIEFNFNVPCFYDLAVNRNKSHLGVLPINENENTPWNMYCFPYFMSGKLFYSDMLEKITALSFTDRLEMEVITKLIGLGNYPYNFANPSTDQDKNFALRNRIESSQEPYYLSLDVPEYYHGKEYFHLFNDLIELKFPLLPLGLQVESPLAYSRDGAKSDTFLELLNPYLNNEEGGSDNELNTISDMPYITTSELFKKKDNFNKKLDRYIKLLKKNSINDKPMLESIHMDLNHLPIFITNPNPTFRLDENMKVLVLVPIDYLPVLDEEDSENTITENEENDVREIFSVERKDSSKRSFDNQNQVEREERKKEPASEKGKVRIQGSQQGMQKDTPKWRRGQMRSKTSENTLLMRESGKNVLKMLKCLYKKINDKINV